MGLIYLATNMESGKAYPGLTTKTLKQRKKEHYRDAKHDRKYGKRESHFHNALLVYDESVWQWSILEDNITTKKELESAEIKWIAFFKSIGAKLYNHTDGGDGQSKGYKPPKEVIEAHSKRMQGNKNRLNIKHTDETKQHLSEVRQDRGAKTFYLTSPEGILTEIFNMRKFCRNNGYNPANMHKLLKGIINTAYGWTRPE